MARTKRSVGRHDDQNEPDVLGISPGSGRSHALVAAASVAIAASVVAVVSSLDAVRTTHPDAETNPPPGYADAPRSSAATAATGPRIPYIERGLLHLPAGTLATTADQLTASGASVLAIDTYYSETTGESSSVVALRGRGLVPLPFLDNSVVKLSLDGKQVASLRFPNPAVTRLATFDLPQGTETGRIDLEGSGSCCRAGAIELLGSDASGRIYFNDDSGSFAWTPGSDEPVAVTGAPGKVVQVGVQGVLSVDGEWGITTQRVVGQVDASGAFRQEHLIEMADPTESAVWSPSGHAVAYTASDGAVVELLGKAGRPVRLDLDGLTFSSFLRFESNTEVLLVARDGRQHELVRCSTAGRCEQVAPLGGINALDDWVFPR